MKTLKEHLEEFPEPYRTQALENMDAECSKDGETPSAKVALACAFVWDMSPQGLEYWVEFEQTI